MISVQRPKRFNLRPLLKPGDNRDAMGTESAAYDQNSKAALRSESAERRPVCSLLAVVFLANKPEKVSSEHLKLAQFYALTLGFLRAAVKKSGALVCCQLRGGDLITFSEHFRLRGHCSLMPAPLGNQPWELELGLKMVKNIDFHV